MSLKKYLFSKIYLNNDRLTQGRLCCFPGIIRKLNTKKYHQRPNPSSKNVLTNPRTTNTKASNISVIGILPVAISSDTLNTQL